ncbi:MAG: FAD-binding oxidoreductase [Chitinispirillaceae bacterium]|nr:FAD-binding oxidoreductase [Chitinispirillaceae bacterium]
MNKILRIDRRNRMAVIEPGVTYGQLEAACAKEGLRVTMPLLPKTNKSVVASLLERQPTTIPKYHYSLTEPLRTCGIVFGNGDVIYTGDAGNGSLQLEEQWKSGLVQVDPKGPNATDFIKIVSGSQGTMGIVFWASVKCEILPNIHKLLIVQAKKIEKLIDFSYAITRQRMGDEVFIVNNAQLANMLGKDAKNIDGLKSGFPTWAMLIGVSGRALFPKQKVDVMENDIRSYAERHALEVVSGFPGVTSKRILDTVLNPSPERYWKLNYRGGCVDIFFLTKLDKIPQFIKTMNSVAEEFNYPRTDIGIYVQPLHQGASYHCEFNLPYNPREAEETEKIRALLTKASKVLSLQGAYFSRPYGIWSDLMYQKDADSKITLRKIKKLFDPNGIMNPAKLCFK